MAGNRPTPTSKPPVKPPGPRAPRKNPSAKLRAQSRNPTTPNSLSEGHMAAKRNDIPPERVKNRVIKEKDKSYKHFLDARGGSPAAHADLKNSSPKP